MGNIQCQVNGRRRKMAEKRWWKWCCISPKTSNNNHNDNNDDDDNNNNENKEKKKSPIGFQIRTFSDWQWPPTANQYEVVVTTDLDRVNPIGRRQRRRRHWLIILGSLLIVSLLKCWFCTTWPIHGLTWSDASWSFGFGSLLSCWLMLIQQRFGVVVELIQKVAVMSQESTRGQINDAGYSDVDTAAQLVVLFMIALTQLKVAHSFGTESRWCTPAVLFYYLY